MITEFAPALLAFVCFLALAQIGTACIAGNSPITQQVLAKRLSYGIFLAVTAAFALLVAAYIRSDFSVQNVYENSHTAKPLIYKITGSWGNHEGSMLLWVWVLTGFSAAYAHMSNRQNIRCYAATLAILGFVAMGFVLFILFTSNPFTRILEPAVQGKDLNPLLQDIGLAMHPPLLYLGYVGFAVVFAMAMGALITRQNIDSAWARRVRPWALLAWSFLTAGIGLGSWWAYRELGWGGWWFWDPVENVSLLPWLAGTALIHCLLVLSKRPVIQNWTLLLALFTFTFSLLGTFLVRSGLLTSVHSFASDPTRGLYVLAFVGFITCGSLLLYALRYPKPQPPDFMPVSREGGVMFNNLLLVTLCATVLLGIVYPLLMQVFAMPSVSVGAPYYNTVVVPVCLPLLAAAGIAPLLAWRKAGWSATRRLVRHALVAAFVAVLLMLVLQWHSLPAMADMPLAVMVALAGLWMLGGTVAYGRKQYSAGQLHKPEAWGMLLAHGGLAIFAVAAAFATAGRVENEIALAEGQKARVGGYEVQLGSLTEQRSQNYITKQAAIHVIALNNSDAFTLYPETRFYPSRAMETAESAINGSLTRDVYAAIATRGNLGNSEAVEKTVILRLYVIPAMLLVWLGFVFASFGGIIASFGYFHRI